MDQFLTSRRTFEFETEDFIGWKHDRDLIPALQSRIARINQAYGYFTALDFETQGINDNGSDVSVRFRDLGSDAEAPRWILAFQLKSHIELMSKDIVQIIKAQRDDAFRKIPDLAHYYIILCCYEKPVKKRLNAIRAEFLTAPRTTIVSPTQVRWFFRLELHQIDAQVKRLLGDADVVLREMRTLLGPYSDSAKALICYLSAWMLAHGSAPMRVQGLLDGRLRDAYERVVAEAEAYQERMRQAREANELVIPAEMADEELSDGSFERAGIAYDDEEDEEDDSTLKLLGKDPDTLLALDLEALEAEFIEHSHDGQFVALDIHAAAPVIAVAADAMVRFNYGEQEVLPYLLDLVGVTV